MKNNINTHPGELLLEDFLKPMEITPYRLAKETKIPAQRLSAIINGRRGITPDTDLRLCTYFGLTPGYWLRGQLAYDLREAEHTIGKKIRSEVQPLKAA